MIESVQQLLTARGPGGALSSLCIYPKNTRFEAQDPQEEIILLLRPHAVTNLWWVILALAMCFVPVIWPVLPVVSLLPANYLLVVTLFWYELILAFAFEQFLMWFFSVNIVTDERIIDVDFYGLLFKNVSLAQLDRIEDVNYYQKGVLGAFFNFGDVLIQTAAEITEFTFNNVPQPERVMTVISGLIAQEKQEELEGRVR